MAILQTKCLHEREHDICHPDGKTPTLLHRNACQSSISRYQVRPFFDFVRSIIYHYDLHPQRGIWQLLLAHAHSGYWFVWLSSYRRAALDAKFCQPTVFSPVEYVFLAD